MAIRRPNLVTDRFTIVPNDWVRDTSLSWKARGLLAYLVSHSEGWSTSIRDLVSHGPDGREAVRTGILELEAAGYLIREQGRDDENRFVEVDYVVSDPRSENRATGKPRTENRTTYKKNSSTEEHQSEHHEQQPRRGRATEKQVALIEDLYRASGRWPTDEAIASWQAMSIAAADTEIRALKRERERYA